jgi:hypothetical protein
MSSPMLSREPNSFWSLRNTSVSSIILPLVHYGADVREAELLQNS